MILSTCPRCSESLRVPEAEVPDDAYAHCPWCNETFPASEIISQLPPIVLLLDSQGHPLELHPTTAAVATAGSMGANPFAGADFDDDQTNAETETVVMDSFREDLPSEAHEADQDFESEDYESEQEGAEQQSEWDFHQQPEPAGVVDIQVATADEGVGAGAEPMRVRAKPPSKKQGSTVRTLVGVALGPLLALPLAGAILLALGRAPNLGFWPFDGSYNQSQQRTAAPPMQSNSSMSRQAPRSQQARNLNSGSSLLDDGSVVAKAVAEITGESSSDFDSSSDPDTPSHITDLNQVPISLPPEDGFATSKPDESVTDASDQVAESTDSEDILALLNADPPQQREEMPEDLLVPEGTAVYPGDARQVSTPPDAAIASDEASKTKLELKPSSVVVSDSVDPQESAAESAELKPPSISNLELPADLARTKDSPELLASIQAASSAMTGLQLKRDESKGTPRDLALTYVAIAEVATHDADSRSDALGDFINEISTSPLLEDLSMAGPQWLNYETRPNDGMLLVGEATSDAGETMITLIGKKQTATVPVVLPRGLAMPKSERVIALGLITSSGDRNVVQLKAVVPLP